MNPDSKNKDCTKAANEIKQKTLPTRQTRSEKYYMQDDIPHIISRILTLAREIGCLSEYKVPVENDSNISAPQKVSR